MFIELKTVEIEKEYVDEYIEKWNNHQLTIDGLQKINILRDAKNKSLIQRVVIEIVWDSEQSYKAWKTHPDHIASHKTKGERPSWIKRMESKGYHLC